MKMTIMRMAGVFVLVVGLTATFALPASAAKKAKSGSGTVRGEVLIITDDFYLIKERNGKGVQVHLDKSTKRSGNIKIGGNVEAQVSKDGRALSIKEVK